MSRCRVAIVSRDPGVRMAAAKAFDRAPAEWSVRLCEVPPPGADVVVLGPDVDGEPGAVPFDPAHPSTLVDDVRRALSLGGLVVAVTGACGGAGATTLALHLGHALSACVVDLTPEGGAARRLGIEEARVYEPGEDPRGASLPVAPGLRLLVAPGAPEAVAAARGEFGRVVVDHGSGPMPDETQARVVVLPPSLPAAGRARELLSAEGVARCAIVVNRLGPGGNATRRAIEQRIGRRVTLMLPCAPGLRDAEDDGRLLAAMHARWRRKLGGLASALRRP